MSEVRFADEVGLDGPVGLRRVCFSEEYDMESDRDLYDRLWKENRDQLISDDPEEFRIAAERLRALADDGNIYALEHLVSYASRYSLTADDVRHHLDMMRRIYGERPDDFPGHVLVSIGNAIRDSDPRRQEATVRESLKWYERAASKGDRFAFCRILAVYEYDLPGRPDEEFPWCIRALRLGGPKPMEKMDDVGMAVDTAMDRMISNANAGHPPSQYRLGMSYLKGDVFERSDELAKGWFSRAAEGGYGRAAVAMEEYERDGNFLALVTREYLQPDDYGIRDMTEGMCREITREEIREFLKNRDASEGQALCYISEEQFRAWKRMFEDKGPND